MITNISIEISWFINIQSEQSFNLFLKNNQKILKHLYTDLPFGYYESVKLKSVINPVLLYTIHNL